jgi:hypothetical protein
MVKCPNCSNVLEQKTGVKKFCAQIGNPELAIVETKDPKFCACCNEYYLTTNEMVSAILQIKTSKTTQSQTITKGIYC